MKKDRRKRKSIVLVCSNRSVCSKRTIRCISTAMLRDRQLTSPDFFFFLVGKRDSSGDESDVVFFAFPAPYSEPYHSQSDLI